MGLRPRLLLGVQLGSIVMGGAKGGVWAAPPHLQSKWLLEIVSERAELALRWAEEDER